MTTNIFDMTDVWNDGGVTWNAIKMDVTDTASGLASRLMDLRVGGSSKFNVDRDGVGTFAGNVGQGDSSTRAATTAFVQQAAATVPGARGLGGGNNAATPTTKFDVIFSEIHLRKANGAPLWALAATFTIDFGLAGPAVNGRDQAAAFSASQFVHMYAIGGVGQATVGLASLAPPSLVAGPALPANYTHWAYLGTVYWNASSNIVPCKLRGPWVAYDTYNQILASGTATAEASISIGAVVPNISPYFSIFGAVYAVGSAGSVQVQLRVRHTSGKDFFIPFCVTPGAGLQGANAFGGVCPNVNQNIYYLLADLAGVADSARIAHIYINGYMVPNGA